MVGAAFIIQKNSGLSLQERRKLKPPNTAKSRVRVLIWQILKRSSSSKTRNSGSLLFSLLGLLLFRWPFFLYHKISIITFQVLFFDFRFGPLCRGTWCGYRGKIRSSKSLVPSTKAMIPMNKKSELNEEC